MLEAGSGVHLGVDRLDVILDSTFRVEFFVADQTSVFSHFKVPLKPKHKPSARFTTISKNKRKDTVQSDQMDIYAKKELTLVQSPR